MKTKIIQMAMAITLTLMASLGIIGSTDSETVVVPKIEMSDMTNELAIMPYADVIVVKTRTYNGQKQYRRWNKTRKYWVDPDWINY